MVFIGVILFTPAASNSSTKYGPTGFFDVNSFPDLNLPNDWKALLATTANHSLCTRTWSVYKTAAKLLLKCSQELHIYMSIPLSQDNVLIFTAFLIKRGLKSSTISSYLAGLRHLHLSQGTSIPNIRSDIVSQILKGRANLDALSPDLKPKRLPVTPSVLRVIKIELKKCLISKLDKRLFWFVSTLAFHGSFRMGELLCKNSSSFDPLVTLLGRDINLKQTRINNSVVNILSVSVKSPKTGKPNSITIVDVFPTNNDLCPIQAFIKWSTCSPRFDKSFPAFRLSSGLPLTSKILNVQLKTWLAKYLDFNVGYISGHSFRAGIPSILGSLGFEDHDIKQVGRWSSAAFQVYLKLPRTKRLAMAQAIGGLNL